MSTAFQSLFHEYGAVSFGKQVRLLERVGELDWDLDLDTGILSFDGRHEFPVQLLGTESEQSGTWLWAWANPSIADPAVLKQAEQLRAYGQQYGVTEFTEAQVPLDGVNGHTLSLVASGLCRADAYYRSPYEGGAAYMLLQGLQLHPGEELTPMGFIQVFTEFIQAFPVHHHTALAGFARQSGWQCSGTSACLDCVSPRGQQIRATFDELGRVTGMQSVLSHNA